MRVNMKKIETELPEFTAEVRSLLSGDLEQRLLELTKASMEVDDSKEDDQELQETKDKLKELNAPYSEAKKTIKMKTKYILTLLKDKGKA